MVELETGLPDGAARHLEEASEIFTRAGEQHMLQVSARLANAYGYLGETRRAWEVRRKALAAMRPAAGSIVAIEILAEATSPPPGKRLLARRPGYGPGGVAGWTRSPSTGYRRRRCSPRRVDVRGAALEDMGRALRECHRIADPGYRRQARAGVLTALGAIESVRDPARALAALSEASGIYDEAGFVYLKGELLLDRSRSLRSLGRLDAAESDLNDALREFEQQRARIGDEQQRARIRDERRRITFFDRARGHRGPRDPASRARQARAGLSALESGRAKGLLQARGGGSRRPQARARIPARLVILEYLVTSSALTRGPSAGRAKTSASSSWAAGSWKWSLAVARPCRPVCPEPATSVPPCARS